MEAIQYILDFGPEVVIPIIMFCFALVFGSKIGEAAKNAMTIGIGFIGLSLLIGFMVTSLTGPTESMVEVLNLDYESIDLGWPLISAFSLSSMLLPVIYGLCFVINLLMISTNTTKTLNVDFWNYWHFVFAGVIVEQITGSFTAGVIAGIITFVITLKIADHIAPHVQEFIDTPNVTFTQAEIVAWAPFAFLMDKIYDRIPGINKIDIDVSKIEEKLGFFGSPLAMGAILGMLIGVLGKLPAQEVVKSGMNFAAVMVLIPIMADVLVSGLIPITESASKWVEKRFENKELYFGISAEITFQNPAVLSIGILMVPITVLLSTILPGNTMMPFADIPYIPLFIVFGTIACNANMFRGLLNGIIIVSTILIFGSDLSQVTHSLAVGAGLEVPSEMLASSIDGGAHFVSYIFYKIYEVLSGNMVMATIVALAVAGLFIYAMKFIFKPKKNLN